MTQRNSRLPVSLMYGGTFDPVHSGHVAILKEVAARLTPEHIQLVLSARPPHRRQPAAPIEDRLAMLRQAFSEMPEVTIDTVEVDRPGPSYTVWTLREMRGRFAEYSLVLLVGGDALVGLERWFHGWEILSLCHLLVYARPGYGVDIPDTMQHYLVSDPGFLRTRPAGNVCLLEAPQHDVAARDIRSLLEGSSRDSVIGSDALPPGVGDYINAHGLYAPA